MDINKLDPQRRELLEARFSKQYQPFENAPFNNGSSGSDSSEMTQVTSVFTSSISKSISKSPPPVLPVAMIEKAKTPPPTKGRKRKNITNDIEASKINWSSSADGRDPSNITGYFGKKNDIVSPQRGNPSPNRNHMKMIPIPPPPPTMNNDIAVTSRATQTDITTSEMDRLVENMVSTPTSMVKTSDAATVELSREISQLEQQLHAQLAAEKKLKEKNARSVELLKEFLIEQATEHKKKARQETMSKRLRLGQFNTVRQGASFVEQWNDGYAFSEINKKLTLISQQKEELDKQRKYLSKRRPLTEKAAEKKEKKEKRLIDDGFVRPSPIIALSSAEYHEQDEILRLRTNAIKKEEQEMQAEVEKLERERNIHIRELKRIHNEDQSRYNTNPILHDRYLLLQLIGKGGFSEVYKGFDLKDLRYVACKVHQLNKDWKEDKKANYIKHAVREYTIHRSLNHPEKGTSQDDDVKNQRIVQLHDVFEIDSNSFVTVLEYCDGNDLDFMLKQYKIIPEKETRAIMMQGKGTLLDVDVKNQVVSALKYLNERKPPVIHYDLKPGNILLGSGMMSWEVKLTDFGLSKILPEDTDTDSMDLTSQGAGTYWYLPPECFVVGKQPPKISSKVDVWSVGIIFYQALYGRKPFGHNLSQASILEQNTILKATNIEFPAKPAVSNDAKEKDTSQGVGVKSQNFIRKCLTYRKEDRVDVFQLALDPYLKPKKEAKKLELQQAASQHHGSSSSLNSRNSLSYGGGDSASN